MNETREPVWGEDPDSWENAVIAALASKQMLELEDEIVARQDPGYGPESKHKFKVQFAVVSKAHASPWHIPMFRAGVTYDGPAES